ncbi:hypothetical protein BDV25DRAFT_160314 [Aspergillus avenaceus]|uniref:Uncharacterized protein n=1 Tax=Aspergillus avenaceus TaxID=36643 RepID=A0A5N6TMA9_ASPAV|nr:hypothetical protein BDV25DRAFT_160314 [Aspergillus avenaceus]
MRFSILALAAAAAAPTALACTPTFWLTHDAALGAGNGVTCNIRIYESSNPDFGNHKPEAAKNVACSGGCNKLDFKGETYEFCFDGVLSNSLKGKATVQRTSNGGGGKRNIFPEGQSERKVFSAYLGSSDIHRYWISNVSCP